MKTEMTISPEEVSTGINKLGEQEAIFCLKALMLAGHVSNNHMWAVLKLCETVKFNEDY